MASLKLKESISNKEYQSEYKAGVDFLKQISIEKGFELIDEEVLFSDANIDKSYFLTKVEPTVVETNYYRLFKTTTFVTAFYVPEDCEYFYLHFTHLVSSYIAKKKSLSDILDESKIIPNEMDVRNILQMSKQSEQHYYQQETIVIDDKVYKRIVLCHPVIPMVALCFSEVSVVTDVPAFYVEHIRICLSKIKNFHTHFRWICMPQLYDGAIISISEGTSAFVTSKEIDWYKYILN